jgi:hypothetical protein
MAVQKKTLETIIRLAAGDMTPADVRVFTAAGDYAVGLCDFDPVSEDLVFPQVW